MKIQINAPHVNVPADFDEFIERRAHESLKTFEQQLTRIEVHLKDENANKGGIDKRCTVEARPRGLDPIVVEFVAASEADAVRKAFEKMRSALERRLGKMSEH